MLTNCKDKNFFSIRIDYRRILLQSTSNLERGGHYTHHYDNNNLHQNHLIDYQYNMLLDHYYMWKSKY